MPAKKRKSNDFLEQIVDIKRKREAGGQPEALDEGGVRGDNVGASFEFSAGSAAEMLSKILLKASPDDIYGEYLWFVKKFAQNDQQQNVRPAAPCENRVGCRQSEGAAVQGTTFPFWTLSSEDDPA